MKKNMLFPHAKKELYIRLLKGFHFSVSVFLFGLFWFLFRYNKLKFNVFPGARYNWYIIAMYAVLLFFFDRTYNSYLLGYTRIRSLTFAQFISQFFSTCIIYVLTAAAWNKYRNPVIFLQMLCICFVLDMLWSFFGNKIFYKINPPKKTVILYRNETDLERIRCVEGKPVEQLFRFESEVCCEGKSFHDVKPVLDAYDAVYVAGVDLNFRNNVLKYCAETGKKGFFLPYIGDVLMKGAVHIQSFTSPVLYSSRKELSPEYACVKRFFDVFLSLFGIVVLSPVMAITAIAVKLCDGGPVIYKQTRLTKNGRKFEIYKFRSMCVDAEKDGKARLSSGEADNRITPVGKVMRMCRLDELPQLFNILKGDMSVVGPRPERPEIAEQYYKHLPEFRLRLQVKAGLTGYAQVYGKYNTEPYEKLVFDLLYINRMSVLTDLRIMFATVGILLKKESTEGIPVEMLTAETDGDI